MHRVRFPLSPLSLRSPAAGAGSLFSAAPARRAFPYTRALALALVALALASSAALEDSVVRFSTTGPDRYADGTIVVDGECYALVWSPAGTSFGGFNADGTAVRDSDRVVLAAPLARDGRCIDVLFEIPADEYAELDGGEWAVCLIDTRTAAGVPAGVRDGSPLRVNRWGRVASGVEVGPPSKSAPASGAGAVRSLSRAAASGVRASTLSKVPASAATPVITGMEVGDDYVALSVAGTVPYLTYTVSSSETLTGFARDKYADKVDGDAEADILLETDATGDSRFFRITRTE